MTREEFKKWIKEHQAIVQALIALFGVILILLVNSIIPWAWNGSVHEHIIANLTPIELGSTALEIVNSGNRDATLYGALFTIKPKQPPMVPLLRPITSITDSNLAEFIRKLPAYDKLYDPFWLPADIGIMQDTNHVEFYFWAFDNKEMRLPAGATVYTNLTPNDVILRNTLSIFRDNVPLGFAVAFKVRDFGGNVHSFNLKLGTYSLAKNKLSFDPDSTATPSTLQLLPSRIDRSQLFESVTQVVSNNPEKILPQVSSNDVAILKPTSGGLMIYHGEYQPVIIIDPATLHQLTR